MAVIRSILALLTAFLLAGGVLGLLADSSFNNDEAFADSVTTALQDPAVNSEVKEAVKSRTLEALRSAGEAGGPLGSLAAGFAGEAVAEQAASLVDTPAFSAAWRDWALLLHEGFTDYASGKPNDQVQITPDTVTVPIQSLIAAVVGDFAAGSVDTVLTALGDNAALTVDSDVDLRVLKPLYSLSQIAWWLLGAAAISLLLLVAIGQKRWKWLGITAIFSSIVLAVVSVGLYVAENAEAVDADYPALNAAIVGAILDGWVENLLILTAALAFLGLVALTLAAVGRSSKSKAPLAS